MTTIVNTPQTFALATILYQHLDCVRPLYDERPRRDIYALSGLLYPEQFQNHIDHLNNDVDDQH